MTPTDPWTRPHPFGAYVAGGQAPAPNELPSVEDYDPMSPDGVSLPPVRENSTSALRDVDPAQRMVETEPVRLLLRPVLVALLALLTAYGLVDDRVGPLWLALVDAVVAVGGWLLIERLRSLVYSRRGATRKADRAARAAAAAGRDAWARTVSTDTTAYRLGPL